MRANLLRLGGLVALSLALVATGCGGDSGNGCPISGQVKCNGVCTDTANDRANCGSCDNPCLDGQFCGGGICQACANECMLGQKRCAPSTTNQYQTCGDPDADSCLEWMAAQACPTGQVCADGSCISACDDDCSRSGARLCDGTANGWRECGNFDADDCLDLGPLTTCGTGEVCVDGACAETCTDECPAADQRRCALPPDNGFEICGNTDADSCLEWGSLTLCPGGETCSGGSCSSTCTDDCTTNQRLCDGNGYRTCGQHDADLCLDWSAVTNCESWQICEAATGQCVTNCTDECESGTKRCSGTGATAGWDLCANFDSDPCLEWGAHTNCGTGYKCDNGQCVEDCSDLCPSQGARMCDGDGYRVCVRDFDTDSCLEWGAITDCPTGETCSGNGQCSSNCTDDCTTGQRRCFGAGYQTCDNHDTDPCLDWSVTTDCQSWEICNPDTGTCISNCTDECPTSGAQICTGDLTGYQLCGSFDQDPCRDLGEVVGCGTGKVCNPASGQCVDDCTDGCTTPTARQCSGDGYDVCGNWDADSCLEWGSHVQCTGGTTCSNGDCVATCTDECTTSGAQVCDGTIGYRFCGEYDGDSCLDLSGLTQCGATEECNPATGHCEAICTDECTAGQTRCDGLNIQICADTDTDPCVEWSTTSTCSGDQLCYRANCVAATPPAKIVISEILIDDEGTDGEQVFIELRGPATQNLNNYQVVGVQGDGSSAGTVYATINLDNNTIPDNTNGHFLIVHGNTAYTDFQLQTNLADLQQGPDSVQVRWAGQVVVDALGYNKADGSPFTAFAGEGEPAEAIGFNTVPYCLARHWDADANGGLGGYSDTDNNAADFWKRQQCSPGWEGMGLRIGNYYAYSAIDATPVVDVNTGYLVVPSLDYVDLVDSNLGLASYVTLFDAPKSSPAMTADGSRVYVGVAAGASSDSGLHCYSTGLPATSGPLTLQWTAAQGTEVRSSPAIGADSAVYFGTRGGGFLAVNPDGSTKWSYTSIAEWIDSSPAIATIDAEEVVVVGIGGVGNGGVYALRTATAATRVKWSWTGATGGCNSSPAIGGTGNVYVSCDDGNLYGFNGSTGAMLAHFPVAISVTSGGADEVRGRSPTVFHDAGVDYVYATSFGLETNLVVVNASTGAANAYNMGDGLSSVTMLGDTGMAFVAADPGTGANWLYVYGQYVVEWYDFLGSYDAAAWIVASPNAEFLASYGLGLMYVGTYDGYVKVYIANAGLYDTTGQFPKFRANTANTGVRY